VACGDGQRSGRGEGGDVAITGITRPGTFYNVTLKPKKRNTRSSRRRAE
jgi:hypothetical protein